MRRLIQNLLKFWLGRIIVFTATGFLLFTAYYVYCAFFAENPQNYFNKEDLQYALIMSGCGAFLLSFRHKPSKKKKEPKAEVPAPEPKRSGSSWVAKAALGLGAAALAKSGPPSKQPNVYSVDGKLKVTGVQHRGGKNWRVHVMCDQDGFQFTDHHDFNEITSGVHIRGGELRVDWS